MVCFTPLTQHQHCRKCLTKKEFLWEYLSLHPFDFAMEVYICFLRPPRSRDKFAGVFQDFKSSVMTAIKDLRGLPLPELPVLNISILLVH